MGEDPQVNIADTVVGLGIYHAGSCKANGLFIRGTGAFIQQVMDACAKLENYTTGRAILSAVDGIEPSFEITVRQTAGENYCYAGSWAKDYVNMSAVDATDDGVQDEFNKVAAAQDAVKAKGGPGDGSTAPSPTSNGTASGSTVYWNPTAYASLRDPAIALAHELCHAIHNSKGLNLAGFTFKYTDSKGNNKQDNMEETHAIGLPPFDTETLCENALRKDWGIAVRANHGRLDAQ
jgi:hypothetical protein